MNQNQLEQARRTRWRQDGNALLTLDDAERWLADTPLCLYLPRRQHLPVPAPTFVEAIAGRPDPTPNPEQIAAAAQMVARLVASGAVIALNLFGAAPGIGVSSFVGEHPDFLATPEALPYLYALQPERNPKREPSTAGNGRVSPLAAEAWKLLEREGALTTFELRSQLGREVTEAAVLRSLAELWHTMRVVPIPAENAPEGAHWELLSARHRRELTIGSTQSQTTALSILVSFYLQSAVAATEEEAEIFLSPVASRSRIRDVIRGLSTTRQLASFPLNGEGQLHVEGSLPEIAEEEETVVLAAGAIGEDAGRLDAGLEQNEPDLTEAGAANPESMTQQKPAAPRRSPRPAFGERARGSFAARGRGTPSSDRRGPSRDRPPRREGGFRRPERSGSSERSSFSRSASSEGAEGTSRPPRPNFERRARPSFAASADRRERPERPGGPGRSDRPKPFARSDRPERSDRSGAGASRGGFDKRPSFGKGRPPRPGGSSFRPGKPFGDRPPRSGEGADRPRFGPAAGAGRPSSGSPRFGQGRPSTRPPRDGERRPPRSFGSGQGASRSDRPFRKPEGDRGSDRPANGPRRFEGRPGGSARPGGFSRPPRRDGESRPPFRGKESRPPFRSGESRPQGDRPFKRPYAPAGDRPPRRGPAGSFGKSGGSDRPPRPFTPRPRPVAGSAESKPEGAAGESRPFRAAGQRPSRPGGFSKPTGRPGTFRKPSFGKRAFGKPSFGKPGAYRKPAGDRPASGGDAADRPRSPRPPSRPAFGAGERPPRPAGRDAASGARKPGGFRKPGAPGKSFGKPRPAGAGYGKPRPAGGAKNRTSTTTSSGKPRRPGGFDKAGPGAPSARPPAKRSFGDFKPRAKSPAGKRPAGKRPDAKRPGAKRPGGGLGAPKRKPRSEGDEG
jgi:23S rRNA pseudouridine2605 synthase